MIVYEKWIITSSFRKTGNRRIRASDFTLIIVSKIQYRQADKNRVCRRSSDDRHPDDPESGCGSKLARFAASGHPVTIIYLTRGEAGTPGKSPVDAAHIRTQESLQAYKIIQAKPVFAGQIDGDSMLNNDWVKKIQVMLATPVRIRQVITNADLRRWKIFVVANRASKLLKDLSA
jgi:GlcNAc-PI de-N-acetylase